MGNLFNLDNPVMVFLGKIADLIILNLVAFVCCIPIVTAGASLTAVYYVTMKMVKKEDGYIVKSFFKSFKENFRQSTIIWLIALVIGIVLGVDMYILNNIEAGYAKYIFIAVCVIGIFYLFTLLYLFPVLARFENNIKNTIKNSFLMSVLSAPKTLLIAVIMIVPSIAIYFIPALLPVQFMLGITLPAYVASLLFVGIFKRFEPEEEKNEMNEEELSPILMDEVLDKNK